VLPLRESHTCEDVEEEREDRGGVGEQILASGTYFQEEDFPSQTYGYLKHYINSTVLIELNQLGKWAFNFSD